MPLLCEYRVVLPMTLEEYHLGREWHQVEKLKMDLNILQEHKRQQGGNCSAVYDEEVVFREHVNAIPFFHEQSDAPIVPGEHLVKQYAELPEEVNMFTVLISSIQAIMEVLTSDMMQLTEVESWDGYPYFCSISRNHHLEGRFQTVIEGRCLPGNVTNENALRLPDHVLKKREVVLVDIAGKVAVQDYRDGKDPVIFQSTKTGRGPLKPGKWMGEADPCMTCYILVSVKCNLMGLGFMLERRLQRGIYRAMLLHHRELFCFIDEWIGTSLPEIRKSEKEIMLALKSKSVSGCDCDCHEGNGDCKKHAVSKENAELIKEPQKGNAVLDNETEEDYFLRQYFWRVTGVVCLFLALITGFSFSSM